MVHRRLNPMMWLYRLPECLPQSRYWTNTSRQPAVPNAWPASRALSERGPASVLEDSAAVVTSRLSRKLPTNERRSSYSSKKLGGEIRSEHTTVAADG